jgi:hypothetical protein
MMAATLLAVFIVPVLYVLVNRFLSERSAPAADVPSSAHPTPVGGAD